MLTYKSHYLPDVIKGILVSAKYSLKNPFSVPVYCGRGHIFKKDKTAKVIINGRLSIGRPVSELSEAKAVMRVRKNATLEINGKVNLGRGVVTIVNDGARLKIGNNTYVAADSKIYASEEIVIGADCALSWDLTIIDSDFHEIEYNDVTPPMTAPIHIGNHVWIGCNVTILKGVTIGDGAIIAAGSVVTNDIPPGCLAAGNPARVIKENVSWD
nr:acyltransferase [Mesobacillus selenatarsenatis]